VLGESIAQLPKAVYNHPNPAADKTLAPNHALAQMFREGPNDEMDAPEFFNLGTATAANWGNFYAEIEKMPGGRFNLWPLQSDRMSITRSKDTGQLVYEYTQGAGRKTEYRQRDILHISTGTRDGVLGKSLITLGREVIGLGLGLNRYSTAQFGNSWSAGLVLQHPQALSEQAIDRLRASWDARQAGVDNAGRPLITEEGMTVQQLSMPNDDAQFIETAGATVLDICRFYGVPPHMVYWLDKATFTNIEHQYIEFVRGTLNTWRVRWIAELSRKLLPRRSGLVVEFDTSRMQMGDSKTVAEVLRMQVDSGIISVNEARRELGYNPVEGGDERMVNGTMKLVEDMIDPPEPAPTVQPVDIPNDMPDPADMPMDDSEDRARRSCQWLLGHIQMPGVVKIEREQLTKLSKRCDSPADLSNKLADFYERHETRVALALASAFGVYEELMGAAPHADAEAAAYCGEHLRLAQAAAMNGGLDGFIEYVGGAADRVANAYFGDTNDGTQNLHG